MSNIPTKLLKQFRDDDELNQWRTKKVITNRNKHSKYYQIKQAAINVKQIIHKQKLNFSLKTDYGKETMVKITSNAKNFQQLKNHIAYISRKGSLELIDSDMNLFNGKQENELCLDAFQCYGKALPNENESLKEKRETYNMVLSMRDYKDCPPDKLKSATFKTIKELYPNNYFVLALHTDTDNPHCHICLKVSSNQYKRIDIKKANLFQMRELFAKNLQSLGIEAQATRKIDRNKDFSIDLSSLPSVKKSNIKPHYYKVIDYGKAPYQHNENNKESFFVTYITPKGASTIWANDLERVINESHLQKGEYAKFARIGYKAKPLSFKRRIDGKQYEVSTAKKIAVWDISVLHRAEKAFNKLPPIEITQTMRLISKEGANNAERQNTSSRFYTKEQWARFYANKRARAKRRTESKQTKRSFERGISIAAGIQQSNNLTIRNKPQSLNDLPTLSQISVVSKRESQVLLWNNAHHKLRAGSNERTNPQM